jgi:hypothetical protein
MESDELKTRKRILAGTAHRQFQGKGIPVGDLRCDGDTEKVSREICHAADWKNGLEVKSHG